MEQKKTTVLAKVQAFSAAFGGFIGHLTQHLQLGTKAQCLEWRAVGAAYDPSTERTEFLTAIDDLIASFPGED